MFLLLPFIQQSRTGKASGAIAIIVGKIDGAVIAAVALNAKMQTPLQLEMLGFSIDSSVRRGVCEGLAFFNNYPMQAQAGVAPMIKK